MLFTGLPFNKRDLLRTKKGLKAMGHINKPKGNFVCMIIITYFLSSVALNQGSATVLRGGLYHETGLFLAGRMRHEAASGDGCGSGSPSHWQNVLKTVFQNEGVPEHLRPNVINI